MRESVFFVVYHHTQMEYGTFQSIRVEGLDKVEAATKAYKELHQRNTTKKVIFVDAVVPEAEWRIW